MKLNRGLSTLRPPAFLVFRRHPQNRVEVGWRTNPCTRGPQPPLAQDLAIALQFRHPQERAHHSHPPHCHHHLPLFHYLSPSRSFLATATRGPSTSSPFLIRATYHPVREESFTILFGLRFGSQAFQYASSPLSSPFPSPIYYIPTYNTTSCHINFHQCCSIVCSHSPFEGIRQACCHRYKRLYSHNPPNLFHLGVCGEFHVGE